MKEVLISLFAFIFSVTLPAQNIDTLIISDTLTAPSPGEVVISANRFISRQLNTPEAIEVLNTKIARENQLRTMPEALTHTPGVFVQKTNHGGGSPFLRGLTGNQTLMLIDGIRLNNSTMRYGPNQYLNTIDIFSIEKIEILRGSGSVQYGSDALGGTIHALSHDLSFSDKKKWTGSLLSRLATHGMEQSFNAGVGYSNRNASFRAGITRRKFGDLVGGDTTGRQSPSGYEEFDYDLKGKILLSPATSVTMLFQSVCQKDIPVYHKIVLEDYAVNKTDPQRRKLAYLRLNQEFDDGIMESLTLTASYQHSGEGRESRRNGSFISRTEYDKVRTLGFSGEAFGTAGDIWSGSLGFEVYNDIVNSSRTDTDLSSQLSTEKRGLYPDGSKMTSLAVFTVHSTDLQKWNIKAGARFNTYIINVEEELSGSVKLTPSALVGDLALMRKLNASSNLFVSLTTGFRAPDIDDLGTLGIVDFRYEMPDFNLKPENSFQYQAGYKYLDRKLRADIYIYRNELYNLIVRKRIENQVIEGYPVYQKENSERAFIQGIETDWHYDINQSWGFNGSLTWTYGQNITNNEPVRRIPPVFGRLACDYKYKAWLLNIELYASGKQSRLARGDIDDNRIPAGGTPGWNITSLNISYAWKYILFDLGFKNIFNKDYRYHGSGVNGYGRSALLSMSINI
jgi:outer membrane receptor protein involved in Fe transport